MEAHDPNGMRAEGDLRERPTSELVRLLAQDTSRLVRGELQLARAEAQERLTELGRAGAVGAAAGAGALLALGALTAALIAALDTAMPTWLAALIVTLIWAVAAAIAGNEARMRLRRAGTPVPTNAIAEMKEDVSWLQERART